MASYTIGATDHVLPAKFWGLYTAIINMDVDGYNATFIQLAKDLRMEVWRLHPNQSHRFWTVGDTVIAGMQNFILNVQATEGTKTLVQVTGAPANFPADSLAPNAPNNTRTGSNPRSPTSVATGVASLISAGVDVYAVEIFNEPSLVTDSAAIPQGGSFPGADGWYVNGATTVAGNETERVNNTLWAIYNHKAYVNAIRAVTSNLRVYALAYANSRPNDLDAFVAGFLTGTYGGADYGGSNGPYFDALSFHPYTQPSYNVHGPSTDIQGSYNSIVYTPDSDNDKSAWSYDHFRTTLDNAGYTSKALAVTEATFLNRLDAIAGIADIAYAIRAANRQAAWNLETFFYTEYDSAGLGGLFGTSSGTYSPTCRYYTLRDMISPFLRKYKHIATLTTTVAPGNTPGATANNPVPRIQLSAGYDPNGNLGVLITNLDRLTAEAVTLTLPGVPIGPVVGRKLPLGATAPVDIGQITVTGTSITTGSGGIPSLGAGEALFLEVPTQTVITPPPPPPPPPNTNPKTSTLSDNFNGNAVSNVWRSSLTGTSTLADTNQRLEITTAAGPTYDWLQLAVDSNNQLGIRQNGANIEAYKIIGGVTTSLATAVSAAGTYFQIREASGTTFWEYGADPSAAMTTLFSVANPLAVTGLQVRIGSGTLTDYAELQSVGLFDLTSDKVFLQYVQTGTSSIPTVFDNCNTAAVSLVDLGSWTTATQINATDPVSPPTIPDIGPWTTAVQINGTIRFDKKTMGGVEYLGG